MDRFQPFIVPGIVREAEQNEQQDILEKLNFNNKESKLKRKNAEEKIIQSDDLLKSAREHREKNDIEKAEADEKGSVQNSLEAMELYGKSVLDADEKKVIQDPEHRISRDDLVSKHNIGALNRSLGKKGLKLYEKKEIHQIYGRLGKEVSLRFPKRDNGQPNYEQPYNAVRYGNPDITNEDAIAFDNMAKSVQQRYEKIADNAMTFEMAGKTYRIIADEEGDQSLERLD